MRVAMSYAPNVLKTNIILSLVKVRIKQEQFKTKYSNKVGSNRFRHFFYNKFRLREKNESRLFHPVPTLPQIARNF